MSRILMAYQLAFAVVYRCHEVGILLPCTAHWLTLILSNTMINAITAKAFADMENASWTLYISYSKLYDHSPDPVKLGLFLLILSLQIHQI